MKIKVIFQETQVTGESSPVGGECSHTCGSAVRPWRAVGAASRREGIPGGVSRALGTGEPGG
ncbi:MAG TPA: hypothetical protein V6D25_10980 [Leptolyngbyaceae cyanobacterium]